MLCERCKTYEAVFHFTDITNNVQTEIHLCNKCAGDITFENKQQNDSLYLKTMFSMIKEKYLEMNQNETGTMCLNCGLTDMEFSLDQKPGCPSCYKYFKVLIESLSGINTIPYSGKKPHNYVEVMAYRDDLSDKKNNMNEPLKDVDLEEQLRIAVSEERYEDAAVLRDRIKGVSTIEKY
ncbi:MAG: UvrB/UvrC motif-containing protein [Spirochaetes bacterium]|nr:UvrB/UvrC motif-containing protein [Spirochaetota bacterium]